MGTLVFQATLGGQVNLTGPNTASTFTISVPAVTGNMITSGDTATVTSTMISGPVTTAKGGTGLTSFTANGVVYASSTSALATGTALVFDGTNFGVGTSSPAGKLQVVSSASAGLLIGFNNTSYNYYDANNHIFRAGGGSAYATIDSSGNLGLGVTPSAWYTNTKVVQLNYGAFGTQAVTGSTTMFNNAYESANGVYNYSTTNGAGRYTQTLGAHYWFNAPSGTAGNAITFTQAMTLDASGNLLLGNPSGGTSSATGGFIFLPNDGGSGISAMVTGHISGSASGKQYTYYTYGSSTVGSITQNGTTGVLYNLTSDYRLKNNPVALADSGVFVDALQPKTWDWWDGSGKGVGFIAHEFMEIAKYSGHGEKDAVDAKGNPIYQSIQPSSSEVMANLVAEIQSLRKRLAAAGI